MEEIALEEINLDDKENEEDKVFTDELIDLGYHKEMIDATIGVRRFFGITKEALAEKYHVFPDDSAETAFNKIMDVALEDKSLYKLFKKDPSVWEIKSIQHGFWTVPVKEDKLLSYDEISEYYPEEVMNRLRVPVKGSRVKTTYQSKCTVEFTKRKPINALNTAEFYESFERVEKEFMEHLLNYNVLFKDAYAAQLPKKKKQKYNEDLVMVFTDAELHLGKLSSKYDSADSYDYKKALYRDNRILEEGIKAADLYKPEKIILTIGNDFFNTDTEKNTTTAGTEQNNDTRYQQMFACGVALHIRAIEELKKHCSKVVVKMMAGNHDEQNANALYTLLYMVYKNDPDVEIDYKVEDTRVASYYVHGDTLLIFDHGKEANGRAKNDAQLGDLMYLPMYEELARRAKHVAIHAGHLHHATYSRLKNGAQVFRNGSPCGDGPWETANGYASDKSHQFYFHSKERGPAYAITNFVFTKEELENRLKVPVITEETNLLDTIDECLEVSRNKIIDEEARKVIARNKRAKERITKEYNDRLARIEAILNSPTLPNEKKEELLDVLGYYDAVRVYEEENASLENGIISREQQRLLLQKA